MNAALLTAYLDYIAAERGLAAHTLENYQRDLKLLFQYLADMPLAQARAHDIRRVVARLHGSGLSGKSLARILSSWRGFYRYLNLRHGYTHNPCEGLRAPKHQRALPHSLSVEQTQQLLDNHDDHVLDVRDSAMFELFYSSGLRLSELAGLTLAQVDMAQAEIQVAGKGNKARIAPIGQVALAALQRWLAQRPIATDALFPGRNGAHLTQRAIALRLKRRAALAGVTANVHPHVLRHAFASHLLQSSGDLRAVQELLGHASISTTQIYTQLDFQHLAATYDQAHPRAKKK
ncbi:MAG: tyrosine recombinase XerC [Sulfuriferula sp.]